MWDKETLKDTITYQAQHNVVTSVLCDQNNQHIIYQGSEDLCVKLWDVRSRHHQSSLRNYVYFPLCIDQNTTKDSSSGSSDGSTGHFLVTGSKGYNSVGCGVRLWDLRMTSQFLFDKNGSHSQDVISVKFFDSNRLILSVSLDGSLAVWNLSGQKIFYTQTAYRQFSCCSLLREEHVPKRNQNVLYFSLSCMDSSLHFFRLSFSEGINAEDEASFSLQELYQTLPQFTI